MESILLGKDSFADKSEYDLRYFYFNRTGAHATCGIAFGTLLPIYRKFKGSRSDQLDLWYGAIAISPNPTVLGYLVEHVCLNAIENVGLKTVDPNLKTPLDKVFFDQQPDMKQLLNGCKTCQLYLPTIFNFPNIDALIVRVNNKGKGKGAYFYPIQITIAKVHKDSEAAFYREQWEAWKDPFVQKGYKVFSTFVWVNREEPSKKDVPEKTRGSRQKKVMVVEHAWQVETVTIKSLDMRLENMIARWESC